MALAVSAGIADVQHADGLVHAFSPAMRPKTCPMVHADARQVALTEKVSGHDLAGSKDVWAGPAILQYDPGSLIDPHTQIGEGDSRF